MSALGARLESDLAAALRGHRIAVGEDVIYMSEWAAEFFARCAADRLLAMGYAPPGAPGMMRDEKPDMFAEWRLPGDPPDILPQVLAARCLGISYGDPGPLLAADYCRECWGDRYVWIGNTWGLKHTGAGGVRCECACHKQEGWLA